MLDMSVAVAIATRNRPASLARLIGSLLAQTRRPDEIIILDDGALPDDWQAEQSERCQAAGVAWTYQRKTTPGRSASRNLAGRLTERDTICFLDDDCEPAPHFLERMRAGLIAYGRWQPTMPAGCEAIVAVESLVIPPGTPRFGDRVHAALLRACGWWALARTRWPKKLGDNLRARPVLCGVCLVYRHVLRAAPFRESLTHGEDREWSVRVARFGRIARVTDAVCLHHVEPAERPNAFVSGVRIARNYLYSQHKAFGRRGTALAIVSLLLLSAGELATGLLGCLAFRPGGPRALARWAGLLTGLFTPGGHRGEMPRNK